mgnify:CR=1 FL=1
MLPNGFHFEEYVDGPGLYLGDRVYGETSSRQDCMQDANVGLGLNRDLTMDSSNQSLPPGWRLDALSPSRDRRDCCLRITTPDGRVITYIHKPFQFACQITRDLERAMADASRQEERFPPNSHPRQTGQIRAIGINAPNSSL